MSTMNPIILAAIERVNKLTENTEDSMAGAIAISVITRSPFIPVHDRYEQVERHWKTVLESATNGRVAEVAHIVCETLSNPLAYMDFTIYGSTSPQALGEQDLDCTVEAEYGNLVVEGSILTLAHHGPRGNRPCPCSLPNLPWLGIRTFGISHVDLDTIGGIMAVLGVKPEECDWVKRFWELAAQIDVEGIHRWPTWPVGLHDDHVRKILNAYYAWAESHRVKLTEQVTKVDLIDHFETLLTLLTNTPSVNKNLLINQGIDWAAAKEKSEEEWAAAKEKLEEESYQGTAGNTVLVRVSDQFVNHLHEHQKIVYPAVVGYNTERHSITISFVEPDGMDACKIAQHLWGPTAGGHQGIAGSPRDKQLSIAEAMEAAIYISNLYKLR